MGYPQIDHTHEVSDAVNGLLTIPRLGALIHTTEGANSLPWLLGRSADNGAPASADYLIDRNGTRHEITPWHRYAYHAGVSRMFHGDKLYTGDKVSQALVGIELERAGDQDITREQYFSLAELLLRLRMLNSWPLDFPLYGHYAVARPLGRRSDPVNFDFGVLFAIMSQGYIQAPMPAGEVQS